MVGVPARRAGWMSRTRAQAPLHLRDGFATLPGKRVPSISLQHDSVHCLDLPEDEPLPAKLAQGTQAYDKIQVR